MRRTEAHQGVRMIKFRDIWGRWRLRSFCRGERANVSAVVGAFEDDGEAGSRDRRLGKVSPKRVPAAREVEALYRELYAGFTAIPVPIPVPRPTKTRSGTEECARRCSRRPSRRRLFQPRRGMRR
jgi:hypothetical protein